MVSRNRGFQSGKHVDLPLTADFENSAAPVADIQIALEVERNTRGNAHALHEYAQVSARRRLIHDSVVSARDVQQAFHVERQTGGIHHIGDEWSHVVVRVDAVNGNRSLLAAGAAEGRKDIPALIDGWIRDRMETVRDLN